MLTASDIRDLSDADLKKELTKARDLLFKQRMGVTTGHLKDSHLIGQLKKYIARLMTIMNARKTAGMAVEKTAGDAAKKLDAAHKDLAKAQEGEKKKTTKKTSSKDSK